ncbi:unnamed protein product [Brassica rapa subsp. narinosa]
MTSRRLRRHDQGVIIGFFTLESKKFMFNQLCVLLLNIFGCKTEEQI